MTFCARTITCYNSLMYKKLNIIITSYITGIFGVLKYKNTILSWYGNARDTFITTRKYFGYFCTNTTVTSVIFYVVNMFLIFIFIFNHFIILYRVFTFTLYYAAHTRNWPSHSHYITLHTLRD